MKEILRFTKEKNGEINEIVVSIRKDFSLWVDFKGHKFWSYLDNKKGLIFYETPAMKKVKIAGIGLTKEQIEFIQTYKDEERIRLEQEEEERNLAEFGEITDESEIHFSYRVGSDFILSKLPKAIRELVEQLEKKDVREYGKVDKWDDINVTMTYKQLLTLVENRKKENEIIETKIQQRKEKEEKEFEEKKKQAQETGENVEISRWSEPCNKKGEECDLDNVYAYVTPTGKIIHERIHTY